MEFLEIHNNNLPENYKKLKEKIYLYPAKPNETIREHTDKLLEKAKKLYELSYIDLEKYKLLCLACEYHDIGKANHFFEQRVKSEKKLKFNPEKEVPHNILSLYLIPDKEFMVEDELQYYSILYAVALHHDYEKNIQEYIEKNAEKITLNIGKHLELIHREKIKKKLLKNINLVVNSKDSIWIKGLLHKCDYAASGNYEIEYANDFLVNALINFFGDKTKNALQNFCEQNCNNNIIAIAQTGMGKTEASLLWLGNNKGYYVLPVRTAINIMYDRISKGI